MVITTLAALLDLALIVFGAWVVRYGNTCIVNVPRKRQTVRCNQLMFVAAGGVISMTLFIIVLVAVAPHAGMLEPWFSRFYWSMAVLPALGALIQMLVTKVQSLRLSTLARNGGSQ